MDASPTPRQTLRLLIDIVRTPDARLEGQIRADSAEPWASFSGVLELLKVLEEYLDRGQDWADCEAAAHGEAPTERTKPHG